MGWGLCGGGGCPADPKRCPRRPSGDEPLEMQCPGCRGLELPPGATCTACGGTGRLEITGCPLEIAGDDAFEMVAAARLAHEKGPLPVAGGWLDQAETFRQGCRVVWDADARWRQKKMVASRR